MVVLFSYGILACKCSGVLAATDALIALVDESLNQSILLSRRKVYAARAGKDVQVTVGISLLSNPYYVTIMFD